MTGYDEITQQFLRALRGNRSQRAFAKRLGFSGNPIPAWEHGRRYPTAMTALRAAQLVGCDLNRAFAAFHRAAYRSELGLPGLVAWMNEIRGSTPIATLSQRAGLSRFAVRRWLSGTSEPRLVDFFRYVDAATDRVYDLVAALVPIAMIPALRERHEAAQGVRTAAYVAPWTEAVLRVVETECYRHFKAHPDGYIAHRLGISLAEEHQALSIVTRAGILRFQDGRYRSDGEATVDTRGDPLRTTKLLEHWMTVARDRAQRRGGDDLFAYNVFTVSDVDLAKAREILRRAYRELRTLAANSAPRQRVALLNMQLLGLDNDPPDVAADGSG